MPEQLPVAGQCARDAERDHARHSVVRPRIHRAHLFSAKILRAAPEEQPRIWVSRRTGRSLKERMEALEARVLHEC